MDTISHREMRNKSAEVLQRVANGETLIVTNHGLPAALLSPITPTTRERLIAQGRLRPAQHPLDLTKLPPRVSATMSSAQIIAEDRDGR